MITKKEPYLNYRTFLEKRYGENLFSVPLDLGFGCPNREEDGSGGCTFCPKDGARAQQTSNSANIEEQIKDAVDFARRRYDANKFMAYIQAYTGTFAPASTQRASIDKIIALQSFESLHIGTRPDCLDDETISGLLEIKKEIDVWIELGVQTSNNKTLDVINRGHTWEQSKEAIKMLADHNIPVIAHVIIGLPGETKGDFMNTARDLGLLPINGVKIHNLHVVKGTTLAHQYKEKPFQLLSEYEYLDSLIEFIRYIPQDVPVIRIQTDTAADDLIAPQWSLPKGRMIEQLCQHMRWRQVCQGDRIDPELSENIYNKSENKPVTTDDESLTFFNPLYKEHYHVSVGAKTQSECTFIAPSGLENNEGQTRVLDVGFGMGYNSILCAELSNRKKNAIQVTALEIDQGIVRDTLKETNDPLTKEILDSIIKKGAFALDEFQVEMLWGDARHTVKSLKDKYDIIFLDPFSTQSNCELYTVEFFSALKNVMNSDARLLLKKAGSPVKAGLNEAGFKVANTPAIGRIHCGTIATLSNSTKPSEDLPYHDPTGIATSRDILKSREESLQKA